MTASDTTPAMASASASARAGVTTVARMTITMTMARSRATEDLVGMASSVRPRHGPAWRRLLRAVAGFVLILPSAARADHGPPEVNLEPVTPGVDWGWTMGLPIVLILAAFVLFVVGFWFWAKRGVVPPDLPRQDSPP
jgi:hypothetical protein